jgi:predicted nucleic acid-binding protein
VSDLVDTNILSEPQQKTPSLKVVDWLRANEATLYTSAIVIAELAFGIESLPTGPKRRRLEAWLRETMRRMRGRILAVNARVALEWGRLAVESKARPLPFRDSLIAATARRYKLTVATDNTRDFAHAGVKLVNPFG